MADISIENHGSIILFRPETEAGKEWLEMNLQEDAQWFGNAVCVEPRYAGDLADGILADGLEIE